ncbi:hypothetical protein TWF696_009521 [Orbilia brochopaga]|uniref:Uncharacterized protein n=1 Tax=Orbilia brochopaga TaxID=3140254 RepID=A0AAV9UBN8_9PEZI
MATLHKCHERANHRSAEESPRRESGHQLFVSMLIILLSKTEYDRRQGEHEAAKIVVDMRTEMRRLESNLRADMRADMGRIESKVGSLDSKDGDLEAALKRVEGTLDIVIDMTKPALSKTE